MAKKPQSVEEETLSRLRRIETRVTEVAIKLGVGQKVDKPVFDQAHATIHIPSMHSSLQEILDSIPEGWHGKVGVCIRSTKVITIDLGGTIPG